ncbi:MAG: type II toxin-antitoxin system VapC family toxin [Anaerolineae bacterium]|jgi:tRNA(fMet)-specific endonuclease VapC|nr:type II toxin-antitoxin system VapC family toxin [Anaerolineae bacterium]
MSGRYLLDTSILIALFAGETTVKEKLTQASEVFVPSIAVGELYYGVWKSQRSQENLARIDELVAESVVLNCNAETARWYGEIKNTLRVKGRPIPENDLWIAAIALEHNLVLATRDVHFEEIDNLKVEMWLSQ